MKERSKGAEVGWSVSVEESLMSWSDVVSGLTRNARDDGCEGLKEEGGVRREWSSESRAALQACVVRRTELSLRVSCNLRRRR